MKKDPQFHEPRAPAIAIWAVTGLLLGVAFGIVVGGVLVPASVGAGLGGLFGLFTTRRRPGPIDDD